MLPHCRRAWAVVTGNPAHRKRVEATRPFTFGHGSHRLFFRWIQCDTSFVTDIHHVHHNRMASEIAQAAPPTESRSDSRRRVRWLN
jgi:hypothetical protein